MQLFKARIYDARKLGDKYGIGNEEILKRE
jgi:hypothetical protein